MAGTAGRTTAGGANAVDARAPVGRLVAIVLAAGLVQAFAVGLVLHRLHDDPAEAHEARYVTPFLHWLRDSALAAPMAVALLLLATVAARRLSGGAPRTSGLGPRLLWAGLGAMAYAAASVPAALVHSRLFGAGHEESSLLLHSAEEAIITLRYSFALLLAFSVLVGLPWAQRGSYGNDVRAPRAGTLSMSRGDG